MIQRSTWYMLGVFALVLAGAVFFQRWQGGESQPEPTLAPAAGPVWQIDSASLRELHLQQRGGESLTIGRDADGMWTLLDHQPGETDTAGVEAAVSQLASLRSLAELEAGADLAVYGLSEPAYILTLTLTGGEQLVLWVGDVTPIQSGYYVQVNENVPQVVSRFSLEAVLTLIDSPPVLPTPAPAPQEPEGEEGPDS
jgi:hypothetical protein